MAASLGADGFAAKPACAAALLLPAVLCADDAVKGVAEEHRELAREALEVMRGTLPADAFGKAYAAVQKRIAARRESFTEDEGVGGGDGPGEGGAGEAGEGGEEIRGEARKIQEYRAGKKVFSEHEEARSRGVTNAPLNVLFMAPCITKT